MATGQTIPTILIDNLKFLLHKATTNNNPNNKCILEIDDTCDGATPMGFLFGTYLGGIASDFENPSVWDNWGGMLIEP